MGALEYDGYRVDETAQICLRVLRDRREPVTTGELRESSDVEQNAQIRYRMDEYLIPSGMVERGPDTESSGKGPESATWRITDRGVEWVDEHEQEIEDARDAAQIVDSLRITREVVDRVDERLDELEGDVDTIQERIHRTEGKADAVVEDSDEAYNRVTRRLDEFGEELESVGEDVEDLEAAVDEQEVRMQSVVEEVNEGFESMSERIERLDESVQEVRKRQEMSLIGRLKAWYRR